MRPSVIAAAGSMLLILLQGCGHKGPLFLPPGPAEVFSGNGKDKALPPSTAQPTAPSESAIMPSSPTTPLSGTNE
jgi:predicted small lipoprotein YifL